jgi:alpha-ketoglutarate-dependent taurine dioxygenase
LGEIAAAMDEFGVVVLPGQNLTDQQLLDFGERFGPVQKGRGNPTRKKVAPPGVAEISNIGPDGELLPPADETQKFSDGNRFWHSDLSFTAAGAALLEELLAQSTQPDNQYSHRWAVGDLVIWGNRRVLHRRGDRFDPMERRSMRRVTVMGDLQGIRVN